MKCMYVVYYKYIHTCIKYEVIHTVHTYQHTNKHSCSHSTYTFIQAFVTYILTHTCIHTYIQTHKYCTYPPWRRKECSDRKVWQGSANASILNSLAALRLLTQTRYHLRYVQRRALRPALSHTHYIHTYTYKHIYSKYLNTCIHIIFKSCILFSVHTNTIQKVLKIIVN
jgi:hypothetical protein